MFKHEDDRRSLIEWGEGKWAVSKYLVATKDCTVGLHKHEKKDERFLLASGTLLLGQIGDEFYEDVSAPCEFDVPRGKFHAFTLKAGSILLGLASEPFDPADDFKS
jgi:hypothetical protein